MKLLWLLLLPCACSRPSSCEPRGWPLPGVRCDAATLSVAPAPCPCLSDAGEAVSARCLCLGSTRGWAPGRCDGDDAYADAGGCAPNEIYVESDGGTTRMERRARTEGADASNYYVDIGPSWDPSRKFCPVCRKAGLKSKVYPGLSTRTLMGTQAYYDENGVFHYEDPNKTTTAFSCSRGHKWTETSR